MQQLKATRKTSRARGYERAPDPAPPPVAGWPNLTLNLNYDAQGNCFTFIAFGPLAHFPADGLSGKITLKPQDVFEATSLCRETWYKTVVEHREQITGKRPGVKDAWPFKDGWYLAHRPELLESLRKGLVTAGRRLFHQVFEKGTDAGLQELAKILRGDRRFHMRIRSDSFYVPWALMYTHPPGAGPVGSDLSNTPDQGFGGFWGIRHIVQHKPSLAPTYTGSLEAVDGLLPTAAYVNDEVFEKNDLMELDKDWASLSGRMTLKIRRNRDEFDEAFAADPLVDRFAYFFCHGFGAEDEGGASTGIPKIVIAPDTFEIRKQDLELLRNNSKFRPPPFIFINACQGGQISTMFYKSVAEAFLELDAMGVIGPQIDIPAKFAAEYAKRFMQRLVAGADDQMSVTIGAIVRELAEEFVRQDRNPLGLVYSLYYGGDCTVVLGARAKVALHHDATATS